MRKSKINDKRQKVGGSKRGRKRQRNVLFKKDTRKQIVLRGVLLNT
jgi:hypothetical protein